MPRTTQNNKSKKAVQKPTGKTVAKATVPGEPRKLANPTYKSFRLSKRLKHPGAKLPGAFKLTRRTFQHVWRYKRLFAVIAVVYLILNLLFVRGFIFTADIGEVKSAVTDLFSGSVGQLAGAATVMGLLVGSLNPPSEVAALYQTILVTLFSIFIIWTLRQTYAGEQPKIKDVFYKSSYPLVPFMIIIFIIGLQLIPLVIGNFLYVAIVASGIATTFAEVMAVSLLAFLLAVWSLYMITTSIFALYIVTLPDMTPLRALRSAKGLVQHRRWTVMRKVLFLPLALSILAFIAMVPIIIFAGAIAETLFLIGSAFILPLVHGYMYSLYRELLA